MRIAANNPATAVVLFISISLDFVRVGQSTGSVLPAGSGQLVRMAGYDAAAMSA
jgi:hypothetical protein